MNVAFPRNLGLKNSTPEGEKIYIYIYLLLAKLTFHRRRQVAQERHAPRSPGGGRPSPRRLRCPRPCRRAPSVSRVPAVRSAAKERRHAWVSTCSATCEACAPVPVTFALDRCAALSSPATHREQAETRVFRGVMPLASYPRLTSNPSIQTAAPRSSQ